MAFKRVARPSARPPSFVSIAVKDGVAHSFSLSQKAYERIGSPSAVHVEWDDLDGLIRIVAASPDDPEAFRVPPNTRRRQIRALLLFREIGVAPPEPVRVPAIPDGPTAVIADLSEYRSR